MSRSSWHTCVSGGTINASHLTVEKLKTVAGWRTRTGLTVVRCAVGWWPVVPRYAAFTLITGRVVFTVTATCTHHRHTGSAIDVTKRYVGPVPTYDAVVSLELSNPNSSHGTQRYHSVNTADYVGYPNSSPDHNLTFDLSAQKCRTSYFCRGNYVFFLRPLKR